MFKKFSIFLAAALCFTSTFAAQLPTNISPQQIEQFKRLPEAQQKALARSMGIDFEMLKRQMQSGSSVGKKKDQTELLDQGYFPRGTMFDAMGNPIVDYGFGDEEEEEEETFELKPFGYDVFANAPQTFAPDLDIAIPADYVIGSGDILTVSVFGKESSQYESLVQRDGSISIPDMGVFKIAGLSFGEAKAFLKSKIQEKVLGVEVVVTLSELRSIRVYVLGEAFKPGPYVLSSLSSVTHALFAAGGLSDIGSLRHIEVKRGGKLVTSFDAYDLLIRGDSSKDIILKSNDVIFISPVGKTVSIDGEVRRPAIYEIKDGENYKELLQMAGGMLPSAYPANTPVERFNENNLRTIITLDLSNSAVLRQPLRAGDNIKISKTSDNYEQSVTLIGAVTRPGKYQWHHGQKLTDLLPNIHSYLLDDADLSYGLVIREKDGARNIEVLQFSMFDIAANNASEQNISLQPQDRILVFSHKETKGDGHNKLDRLAMTQDELNLAEKEKAKLAYEDRMFWVEYGKEENATDLNQEEQEELEQVNKTLEQLSGEDEDELLIDPRDLNPFSRKLLLQPVIEKLRQQAAAGEPMALVEIVGSVKYPGVYPLSVEGDVNNLVAAAGGLRESAYLVKAELTRNNVSEYGATKESIDVSLQNELSGKSSLKLISKDRLNVLQIPAWQDNHIVELKGEFKFPGKYTIQRGETLSQLIERVGGYTEYAYLSGSVFTREKLKELEYQNLVKVADSLRMQIASRSLARTKGPQINYSQAKLLLADLTKVTPVGRLVVDLPNMHNGSDVLLEDGDVLYVPTKQNSINVMGQVQVATAHLYRKDLTASDYIEFSGGVRQQADEERIYVIKANGSVEVPTAGTWFSSGNQTLEPGDTVVVPLDSEYMDNLSLWATGTQIIYQTAVAIAAIAGI